MFVALRDLRFAKGRFALMGTIITLLTALVVGVSGLASGLAHDATSAVAALPATHIAFGAPGSTAPEQSFPESWVTIGQAEVWRSAEGVRWAEPLGVSQNRLETITEQTAAITVFGVPPDTALAPDSLRDNTIVLDRSLAEELDLAVGNTVAIGAGRLRITAISEDAPLSYSHSPVVWTTLDTWHAISTITEGPATAGAPGATVIATALTSTADPEAVDATANTDAATVAASLTGIAAYRAESSSLRTIQFFLYGIAVLVTGAFLAVWTIQRTRDVAILKALGASTRYLLRDALTQALLVLCAGAAAGGVAGVAIGALAGEVMPLRWTWQTTVLPVAAMIALGMAGAALAVRRITLVDPLSALGDSR